MSEVVQATTRTGVGKGYAKRLRRGGKVPAVLYGAGVYSKLIEFEPKPLRKSLAASQGINSAFELEIDGTTRVMAMVQSFAKHPVTDELLHVDFRAVRDDTEVVITVPVRYTGRPLGVRQGGRLKVLRKYLTLRTTPGHTVAALDFNIESMGLDSTLRVKDAPYPPGCSPVFKDNFALCSVSVPKSGGEGEGEAAATPAAAAAAAKPATAAAKPAAAAAKPAAAKPAAKK